MDPDGSSRSIEVKGRRGGGTIALSENKWSQACNLRDQYWLYVVYDCVSSQSRLIRVQDSYRKFRAGASGGLASEKAVRQAAQMGL